VASEKEWHVGCVVEAERVKVGRVGRCKGGKVANDKVEEKRGSRDLEVWAVFACKAEVGFNKRQVISPIMMHLQRSIPACLFALLCLCLLSPHAQAQGLTGSSVTGNLQFGTDTTRNYYDPANGYGLIPVGYGNYTSKTVVIGPEVEFGYQDAAARITSDFTFNGLALEYDYLGPSGPPLVSFKTIFTDPAFSGLTLSKLSDSFAYGGLSYSLTGTTLTVSWPGGTGVANAVYKGTFSIVPEPSVPGLFLVGGLGLLSLAVRRRFA
jgi:hypothetical protein